MSHVDEGTLHAYLDGELSPNERAGLEAHLEQCIACKAMLTEERALLERASALLGSARPAERPAPPFQEVRRAQRRPWYARRTFAWAASLVLAVGLGYYLRGSEADLAPPALSEHRAVAASEAESVRREQPQVRAFEKDEFASARPTTKARLSASPASDVTQAPRLAAVDSLRRPDSLLGFGGVQPPVTIRGAAPRPDTAVARRDLPLTLDGAIVAAAPPPRAELPAAAASAGVVNRNDSRSVRNLVSTTWPIISRGAAASLLGDKPVGVPGLATRRIRRSPGADSTVVVEQALDSSTIIQIFQRPATARLFNDSAAYYIDGSRAREAAPAAAPAPADRLARFVGKLRVEISGPVSTDSLNRLLEQLEPLP